MTSKEINELAHEIAEESAKSTIECNTSREKTLQGQFWNLRSADSKAAFYIKRDARYLRARGVLKQHPKRKHLVTWEGDND